MYKIKFIDRIKRNSDLAYHMTKREILLKYKGSKLGVMWTIINPIIMMSVYTLIFSQIFQTRWAGANEINTTNFAINLYTGLIVFNIYAETIARAPTLITSNPNFVKKIIFPLEVLSVATVGSAIATGVMSMLVLLSAILVTTKQLAITTVILPILWAPLLLNCLSLAWILSTIGVFVKDLTQVTNSIVSITMFLSPIFYPSEALPDKLRWLSQLNPLAYYIEKTRIIIIEGKAIDTIQIAVLFLSSLVIAEITFRLTKKLERGIGDYV